MPHQPKYAYDHHWRKLRKLVLVRDGYRCYVASCLTRATTADHIIPVLEGGRRLDPANCRASCTTHNYGRAMRRGAELARISRSPGTRRQW